MQRYYQGQLDFFCAVYAVINALTAMFGINLTQARMLFATALYDTSKHPSLWLATLENKTDFHWLVAYMIQAASRGSSYPLRAFRPFVADGKIPDEAADLAQAALHVAGGQSFRNPGNADTFWRRIDDWLLPSEAPPMPGSVSRTLIFRFHRYIPFISEPVISHWSVADHIFAGKLHLRDCSKEERALHNLDRTVTVLHPDRVDDAHNVRIEPESVFFLEKR